MEWESDILRRLVFEIFISLQRFTFGKFTVVVVRRQKLLPSVYVFCQKYLTSGSNSVMQTFILQ